MTAAAAARIGETAWWAFLIITFVTVTVLETYAQFRCGTHFWSAIPEDDPDDLDPMDRYQPGGPQ